MAFGKGEEGDRIADCLRYPDDSDRITDNVTGIIQTAKRPLTSLQLRREMEELFITTIPDNE